MKTFGIRTWSGHELYSPADEGVCTSDKHWNVRTIVFDLLERLADADELPSPIVEFGALRVASQTHLPTIRSMFPGHSFTGVDMAAGIGVDQRQDLHRLGLRDGSVGTALLLDTLEHVEKPKVALDELRRCMAADGILLLTSHFFFPIHQFPADYWRFTAQGIAALLDEFDHVYSGEAGLRLLPHTVVGLAGGPKVGPRRWQRFSAAVEGWQRDGATSWKERLLSMLPPVLIQRAYEQYTNTANRIPRRSQFS